MSLSAAAQRPASSARSLAGDVLALQPLVHPDVVDHSAAPDSRPAGPACASGR